MMRFFYKLLVGLIKGIETFFPGSSKKSGYLGSKSQEDAFLRKADVEKKKIIREYLAKQGYTPEEIQEIEKKNLEIVENMIEVFTRKNEINPTLSAEGGDAGQEFNSKPVYKYSDLIAGIAALVGAIVVFIFFMNVDINPNSSRLVSIAIKPGYESWAWRTSSLSLILYDFVRSKGKYISGGYINPIFKLMLEIMWIIPIIGFMFSLIGGAEFILESQVWNAVVNESSHFLNSIIVLFVFA